MKAKANENLGHNIIILDEMDRNDGHKSELFPSSQKNGVFMIWRRNGAILFLEMPATADNTA